LCRSHAQWRANLRDCRDTGLWAPSMRRAVGSR
jgi:hypothetical protein